MPGRVKTRLARHWGEQRSAELYAAFVADTADKFRATAERRCLCYTPQTAESAGWFSEIAGDDFEIWPQPDGSLGERLEAFFQQAFAEEAGRVVVIGSDSPTLPREYVEQAFVRLGAADRTVDGLTEGSQVGSRRSEVGDQNSEVSDCVLGPATDGGYYLVGLRERLLPIFHGIDWGTARVLAQTVARLRECGAILTLLPAWSDVDTSADLEILRRQLASHDSPTGESPRTAAFLFSTIGEYTDPGGLPMTPPLIERTAHS